MGTGALPFRIGVDLGSTTVKVVAVESASGDCIWRHYERHEMQVAEKLLACLRHLEKEFGIRAGNCAVCATGSAAAALAPALGARFVQEVHALSLIVERMHPDVRTVIELGGQDAKIIVFREGEGGALKKLPSMNDKCAGGTGAIIDKIAAKLNISPADLERLPYAGVRTHPIAGKCGVFAETDITGLLKQGIPSGELLASLFDAIVLQNLSVLTRGYVLRPKVLLLGGPNTFFRGLREAWQQRIPDMWRERGVALPADPAGSIQAPPLGHCYGALGALEFGRLEGDEASGRYRGHEPLEALIRDAERQGRRRLAVPGLVRSDEERDAFVRAYAPAAFVPPRIESGERVPAFLGIDAGSTSTKGVLLSPGGGVIAKAYRLSLGNPIDDAMQIIGQLRGAIEDAGGQIEVLGAATTGYAKDILRDVLRADVAIAETVAHTESAKQLYADPHVIVDVGGQDIKLIFLKDGRVKDFRLNTQCSAGNGYFLHATAESFGIPVERFAEAAFTARGMPLFGYGCAVFLQSDIATFQRHGWTREEILAGLAAVLPKNVFLYVARVPNLARLGTRFILQGGTQRNLAVVKAEVDFIRDSFARSGVEPEIVVHAHAGECGAIGAALEAMRLHAEGRASTFIGMAAAQRIEYRTQRGSETRCALCRNRCARTFIDITAAGLERRVVAATCERGTQLDVAALRAADAGVKAICADNPDFVDIAAREVWRAQRPSLVADVAARPASARRPWGRAAARPRTEFRVGVPRVLNMYSYAPLFSAYLESLGVLPQHIVYSDVTSAELYRSGSSRGSIDPCFPSKVALAHVHNLLAVKHPRTPLDCIFFPMFDVLDSPLVATRGQYACPTVAATPRTVKAAFTKESDAFAEAGVLYLDPLINLANRRLLALQMFDAWSPLLALRRDENARALEIGFAVLDAFWAGLRTRARNALDRLEREGRLGIVVLGRPYHHDPGVNHGILSELQKRGYTIFSQAALPRDEQLLERLFGDDVRRGLIRHPLDISDVWKHTTSENTNQKIWAAKFVARHPNLVALEFSSFKCGHDAPVYSVIESIVEAAGRPYLGFKDLDENRAVGAVKLRLETMDYFLKRYLLDVKAREDAVREIQAQLWRFEQRVRRRFAGAREARALS